MLFRMLTAVALGGAAGSVARYWLTGVGQRLASGFPSGTLLVNVAGSLLLGFLARFLLATGATAELRAALTIGLCGGFTTFSTFSYETVLLLESGSYARAAWYVVSSVLISLAAVWAGFVLARSLIATAR